jgi:hypothetical protein
MMTNRDTLAAYQAFTDEPTAHGYVWFLTTMLDAYNRERGNPAHAPVRTQAEFDAFCQQQVSNTDTLQAFQQQYREASA